MANIYDVNAAIAKPNVLDSFRTGQQYGMRLREQQQAQQDEQALRGLAPQVVAGDPGAYERAAAIDPQAAGQYDAANVNMAKRAAGAAAYMLDAVKRGNPQEIQGRYQAVLPFLTKLGASQGKTPPPQFDPAMVPAMEQIVARAQGMGQDANAMPAGFQELHMKALAAGLQPGTPEYQQAMNIALGREGRAATGGFGFQKVIGADGRERMGRQNPRTGMFEIYDEQTGDFVPMGGGGALNGGAPMGQPSGVQLDNRPYTLDPDMAAAPSPVAGAITQQEQAAGNRPWTAATPNPYGNAMPRPSLGVGRSPEEQAALTTRAQEQAKTQAQLDLASEVSAAAAAEKAATTEAEGIAKGGVEYLNDINERAAAAASSDAKLQQLEFALSRTYSGFGAEQLLNLRQIGAAFGVGNSENLAAGELARSISNKLALGLRNPAGGEGMPGAMSNADRDYLKASVPSLQTSPGGWRIMIQLQRQLNDYADRQSSEANRFLELGGNASQLRGHMQRWANENPIFKGLDAAPERGRTIQGEVGEIGASVPRGTQGIPTRIQNDDEYDSLPSGALFIAPGETRPRRKP